MDPKTIIVEKVMIDLKTGQRQNLFALAASEPFPAAKSWSLTFEAYLSAWTADRATLEGAL